MSNFARQLIKGLDENLTSILEDGKASGEFTGYIDTGSYIFNAQLSGSLYGGMPNNRILEIVGESATGKTFFAVGLVKSFLDSHPEATVAYFDTESNVNRAIFAERGCDNSRIIVSEPNTVQKFRHQCLNLLETYEKTKDRPPLMIVLDSLGNMSTTKELEDAISGAETRDMTKAQVIKATFRTITIKLGKLQVPMVVCNQVYAVIGAYVPTKAASGGSGPTYNASAIIDLSKTKDINKKTKEVVGCILKAKAWKGRLTKENTEIHMSLNYRTGLDRYFGLLELGEKYDIIKKVSTRYEFPDGTKAYEKHIYAKPEKYFTPEIMEKLEEAAAKEFKYGMADDEEEIEEDTGEE